MNVARSSIPEQNKSTHGIVHKDRVANSRAAAIGIRVVIPSSAKVIPYASSNPAAAARTPAVPRRIITRGIVLVGIVDVNRWDEKAGLRTGCGVRSQVIDVLKAQIKRRPAMKKVSIRAAAQSRNISQQKLTIGLDLGDRNSWYCVVDETGQIQLEQRVRTSAKALQEVFGAIPRSRIALEIGTHSPWISRLLSELGHEVIVANARKVRLIGESRKKDDRLDAQTLARWARIDPELP